MLAYLAVPVRFLFSLYGICWCVRASLYFLASPKSIIYTRFPFFPSPMRKLSGLTSRWMKFLECMYSILLICNKHKVMYIFCNFGQKCLKNNNTTAPRYNYYSIEDIFILKGIFKTLFFSQCPFVFLYVSTTVLPFTNQLICQQQDCFETEFSGAEVEEIFQTGP